MEDEKILMVDPQDEAIEAKHTPQPVKPVSKSRRILGVMGLVGFVLSIVAWWLYCVSLDPALVAGCSALVLSISGAFAGRGCLRDLAITGIIISAVLLIVFSVFYWGVPYVIDSI